MRPRGRGGHKEGGGGGERSLREAAEVGAGARGGRCGGGRRGSAAPRRWARPGWGGKARPGLPRRALQAAGPSGLGIPPVLAGLRAAAPAFFLAEEPGSWE